MANITVRDRSLPMSQGVIESGGSARLHQEFESEYHEPSQHSSQLGVIHEGPQAEDGSVYKAEGASKPVTARVSGHSLHQQSNAMTAQLNRGQVLPVTATPPSGETRPVVASIDQPRATVSRGDSRRR